MSEKGAITIHRCYFQSNFYDQEYIASKNKTDFTVYF